MIRFADAAPAAPAAPTAPDRPASGTSALDTERLGDEIAELAAHIHAATYRLLVLLAEFDTRVGWGGCGSGFRSCAHWLSWRTGIALGAAREKVRVARALPELPQISAAMRGGALSYSKVRALTRVATPANEGELLVFASHGTTAHVERLVRAWRQVDRNEAAELEAARHEARSLSLYEDDDGSWVLRGRLDPEVGAVLRKALDAAAEELRATREAAEGRDAGSEAAPRNPTATATHAPPPEPPDYPQRQADAIGLLAERALASDEVVRRAERYQVVVHVGAGGVLGGAPGDLHVSAETSRRLSCDATTVRMDHDERGAVLDVGRRTRTVPPALRRALEFRDGACRFPGCGVRHTDAHHVRHWAEGGETALSNLLLLCRFHHRAVHEGGVAVKVLDDGGFEFSRPDGQALRPAPRPPRLPVDPAAAMFDRNRSDGIAPGPWTPTPDWHGERLDLAYAIDVLRR